MTATAPTDNNNARKEAPNFGISFYPKCNSMLERTHRNRADKLLGFFYTDVNTQRFIYPNVWHEGIFPLAQRARFYDEQGNIHALVSVSLASLGPSAGEAGPVDPNQAGEAGDDHEHQRPSMCAVRGGPRR